MDKYIGKRLDGRYEIREIIGVGGMAYVYKAYDNIDDRIVAVKILKEEYLANEDFTRRFKNESKAIAILSHPNIVKVYDVSFGERLQYIVMECVDGITLKEYIDQQKQFKWKEAVHFTVQILRALQHAHDKGIVHRDIKPQNIMLLPDGTIKVADFGIARFSRQDIRATRNTDKAIGSVHYISPEQARGDITDEKADIYSVGVMMYEMLTGQLPFEADNAVSVAIMQLQSEAKPIREIDASIPEGLEEITVKAMQKDPSKRYQSAAEMLNDIEEFKKNPSIHFEYKYFVDDSPTRYVEAISKAKGIDTSRRGAAVEEEEEEEGKRGFPIIPVLCAVAAAFLVVAVLFLWSLFANLFGNENVIEVKVPNFVGMKYEEIANNATYRDNFIFAQPKEIYDTAEKGVVIGQDIPANTVAKKGAKTVTLTVSLGPRVVPIPDVVGLPFAQAEQLLRAEEFDVVRIDISSEEPVDTVITCGAEYTGGMAPHGAMLKVEVSAGPDAVEVPSVVNLPKDVAKERLEKLGFVVEEVYVNYTGDTYKAEHIVLTQSIPNENVTVAVPGATIALEISTGYKDVELQIELPNTDMTVDLQIYEDGKFTQKIAGIIPNDVGVQTVQLLSAKDTYTVTVKIAKTGTADGNFVIYARYTVDGANGTVTLVELNEEALSAFMPTTMPPTTTTVTQATTAPTTTATQPATTTTEAVTTTPTTTATTATAPTVTEPSAAETQPTTAAETVTTVAAGK